MEIPPSLLAPATLRAVIEEFVTREGTDYGGPVLSLDEKVAQVEAQLARGEVRLLFDPDTETVTLAPRER
ncbi:MAG: YheU family protein [Pseudomonadales bacterium]|nr:YheU family protein [Pseudomonadales bacterium]